MVRFSHEGKTTAYEVIFHRVKEATNMVVPEILRTLPVLPQEVDIIEVALPACYVLHPNPGVAAALSFREGLNFLTSAVTGVETAMTLLMTAKTLLMISTIFAIRDLNPLLTLCSQRIDGSCSCSRRKIAPSPSTCPQGFSAAQLCSSSSQS